MAHEFGIDIPVPVPAAGEAAGDILLKKLLAFCSAVLNAHAQTCWDSVSATQPVVRETFAHKPEENSFRDRDLPALYAWRERHMGEQLADEVPADRSRVVMLWVPEPAPQETLTPRTPFANAVYRVVRKAMYDERDPAWIDTADPDVHAPTHGSWLWGRTNVGHLKLTSGNDGTLTIPFADGSGSSEYPTLQMEFEVLETLTIDGSINTEPAAVSVDIFEPDIATGLLVGEFDDPVIP